MIKGAIPQNTTKQTNWTMGVWEAWRKYRSQASGKTVPELLLMTKELSKWVNKFVVKARCKDGKEYTSNTLHQLVCGIQRYLRENGKLVDFFLTVGLSF